MNSFIYINKESMLNRFLKYIAIDTRSDPEADTFPSNQNQYVLAKLLAGELKALGLADAAIDRNGYVLATLPANTDKDVPVIGFIAHMDTSPDACGTNISAKTHANYDGQDLLLNTTENIVMRVADFPDLRKYTGQTLITSDGTTLLGADNKAGIAEIMAALEYLADNPRISHGTIKVAFTPDEEIGKGVDYFDVEQFGADFAYTIDGGELGELQYENFNAAHAKITIHGRNIHPGEASGKMINACLLGMELNQALPSRERPEHTTGYEGFFHLTGFRATVDHAVMEYIIRDHDHQHFDHRKAHLRHAVNRLNDNYGQGCFQLEIKDQYYNMHSKIFPVMHIVELAKKAMKALDIRPLIKPIRGGTDGSRLSYMGLPCPNIFAGGHNYHGRFEFIPLESMEKASQVIVKIIEMSAA